MEKKLFAYPATFTPTGNGAYGVFFPDLEINTDGESMLDALDMAHDALSATLCTLEDIGRAFPQASDPVDVPVPAGGFVSMVITDVGTYRAQYDQKLVKKTLNIPQWLNAKAEAEGINFSQLLQTAIKERLGIQQ